MSFGGPNPLQKSDSKRAPNATDIPTRRRSYDLVRLTSEDEKHPERPLEPDSWESVTSQPYWYFCIQSSYTDDSYLNMPFMV